MRNTPIYDALVAERKAAAKKEREPITAAVDEWRGKPLTQQDLLPLEAMLSPRLRSALRKTFTGRA